MEPDGTINRWVVLTIGLLVGCAMVILAPIIRDAVQNYRHLKYWSDCCHHRACECQCCELRDIAEINQNYD